MAKIGVGQSGYTLIQKETIYGTAVSTSMTTLMTKDGSKFDAYPKAIENKSVNGVRLKLPNTLGQIKAALELNQDHYPTLIGLMQNLFLGTSADSGPLDSAYTHRWFVPISGNTIGKSATIRNAKGDALACQFAGVTLTKWTLKADSQNNVESNFEAVAQSYTEGIARASVSTLSTPAIQASPFYHVVLKLTPSGGSQVTVPCNSIELVIDLNYEVEDYKTGSQFIQQPQYKGMPMVTLKANIEADDTYKLDAQAMKLYKAVIEITSVANIGAGTTKYKTTIELPSGQLKPDTVIPYQSERANIDLDFDFAFGGLSTTSGTDRVMGEITVIDATPTYA
jgi:hypothetical protein